MPIFIEQVRTFYLNVLDEEQRKRLCENIACHLKDSQLFIQKKAVSATLSAKGWHLLAGEENAAIERTLQRENVIFLT